MEEDILGLHRKKINQELERDIYRSDIPYLIRTRARARARARLLV